MSQKFGKYREVDDRYLNVPVKYCLNYTGANEDGKDKYEVIPFEQWKKEMEEWNKTSGLKPYEYTFKGYKAWIKFNEEHGYDHHKRLVKKAKDKTLCIVDFYGKDKALVAWRNNDTCKMGMTKMCKIVWKNGKMYLRYKGKLIQLSGIGGWVL